MPFRFSRFSESLGQNDANLEGKAAKGSQARHHKPYTKPLCYIMRKILLTYLFLLVSTASFSCTCIWDGNFIKANKGSESLIIKAKVIGLYYRFVDKEVFDIEVPDFGDTTELVKYYEIPFRKFVRIEIKEKIQGNYSDNFIELLEPNGFDCTKTIEEFKKDKWYVLSIIIRNNEYRIHRCSENTLEYYPELNKVKGRIKGNYRKREIFYDYDKLIKKIT